jgi:hypothetical protein
VLDQYSIFIFRATCLLLFIKIKNNLFNTRLIKTNIIPMIQFMKCNSVVISAIFCVVSDLLAFLSLSSNVSLIQIGTQFYSIPLMSQPMIRCNIQILSSY